MAILDVQLVITVVMVCFIQRLGPHFSFAKWILCSTKLFRYLHPTDEELRAKAGISKEKSIKSGKNKYIKHKNIYTSTNQFHVPRNVEIELEIVPVIEPDVIHLRYFTEFQWLLDFSVYAGIVYIFSEIYHFYFPLKNEVNLSMIWCLLVVFFSLKLLSSLTILYFQSDESVGERSMVIVACLVYFLIAMIVLIVDETLLETGLDQAYTSFNKGASTFLSKQGLPSSGPASKIVLKFFMAIFCGVLGSLFTFPGLRLAKMHWDSLKYCKGKKLMQLFLNISFILPFLLVILWIKPISRDYLTVRVFEGMREPLLKPCTFETIRLSLVVLVVLVRLSLMPIYIQSYLNLANDRISEMRKEAGRITNLEYQKKISSIFYYLCVATLQFIAPLVFCLYLTLLYKNLGGFKWTGSFRKDIVPNDCAVDKIADIYRSEKRTKSIENDFHILQSVQSLQASLLSLKNVFSSEVYKGFLGFASWWSYFMLFVTSTLGIIYQTYFGKA